jgi:hypothetical protein
MKKMTKAHYDKKVHQPKLYAHVLVGTIQSRLENDSPDDFVDGTTFHNHRLKDVAKAIDNVLGSFDALQKGLGLNPGHKPRHHRFLHDRSN